MENTKDTKMMTERTEDWSTDREYYTQLIYSILIVYICDMYVVCDTQFHLCTYEYVVICCIYVSSYSMYTQKWFYYISTCKCSYKWEISEGDHRADKHLSKNRESFHNRMKSSSHHTESKINENTFIPELVFSMGHVVYLQSEEYLCASLS